MAQNNMKKGKGNGKGPKPTPNPKRDPGNMDPTMKDKAGAGKRSSSNDPAWYMRNSANAEWVGRFSFAKPLGTPLNLEATTTKGSQTYPTYAPGLMTLRLVPTIGVAKAPSDAVNACATKYFTNVRSKISGSRSYVAPDLMLYTIAAAQLYSMYVWGARLYSIARSFDQQNRYIGDALLQANGINSEDFRANIANWLFFLNQTAVKINSFAVPDNINYFRRQMFLYSGIYRDSNTAKAQLYMNVPDGFLKYDGTGSEKGGRLLFSKLDSSLTYDKLTTYFNDLVGAMYGDEDMYTMSGDVYKAYAPHVLLANSVSTDYTVPITYDAAVLTQFENAVAVGPLFNLEVVTQDPDTGTLLCDPTFFLSNHSGAGCDFNRIMNFHHTDVSAADVFEAAPLCCAPIFSAYDTTNGGDIYKVQTMGTEVATEMAIWTMSNGVPSVKYSGPSTFTQLGDNIQMWMLQTISDLTDFDWHPLVYQTYSSSASGVTTGEYDLQAIYGDLDVYRSMSASDLANIHDCALWSLFDVV